MNVIHSRRTPHLWLYGAVVLVISLSQAMFSYGQSPELLSPGSKATIGLDALQSDCSTNETITGTKYELSPITTCIDDPAGITPLQVFAASAVSTQFQLFTGIFSSIQNHDSTAKLFRDIQIPHPGEGAFSSTLRLQVATEVEWSGGFLVGGAPSTYAQVTATLQLRDVTDAETGPVVASDTFFVERFDAVFDLALPTSVNGVADLLNQVDAVDVSSSSGSDLTALIQRGRTYRIELETKCDVGAPVFGFAICLFGGDSAATELQLQQGNPLLVVFANDGFRVAPFEVTVESDPVEEAASQL